MGSSIIFRVDAFRCPFFSCRGELWDSKQWEVFEGGIIRSKCEVPNLYRHYTDHTRAVVHITYYRLQAPKFHELMKFIREEFPKHYLYDVMDGDRWTMTSFDQYGCVLHRVSGGLNGELTRIVEILNDPAVKVIKEEKELIRDNDPSEAAQKNNGVKLVLDLNHRHLRFDQDTVTVGRLLDCDICLDAASVSRQHATFVRIQHRWYIKDSSTNGTIVNGKPLAKDRLHRLDHGDQIRIGSTYVFKFYAYGTE